MKNPEIPLLHSYFFPPAPVFWKHFPKVGLPAAPTSPVNIGVLRKHIEAARDMITVHQYQQGLLACKELAEGADPLQKSPLPADRIPNSATIFEKGPHFTDSLASWLKLGFVAGPFVTPLVEDFRANQMIAIEQKGKICIVMNLSAPEGASFNDNVDERKI
jgi:hypothetical protein